jgi:capsular polysaccharide biosynthesis protein
MKSGKEITLDMLRNVSKIKDKMILHVSKMFGGGFAMDNQLLQISRVIKNRIWVILLVILVVCSLTAAYTRYFVKPMYEASTRMIVNNKSVVDTKPLEYSQLNASIQLIETYKQIITSSKVMDVVVKAHPELGLSVKQLHNSVNVSSVNNTQVMIISATDSSYEKATKIANAVAHEFQNLIPAIMKVDNVSILDEAGQDAGATRTSVDPILSLLLAFVLSLLLSTGLVITLEYFDDRFKSEEDIQNSLGIPQLGTIFTIKKRYLSSANVRTKNGRVAESKYAGVN